MSRFILALLFLTLAFVMQFWFASFGVFIDFILATLITLSFLFDIWDVLFFILAAIFIVNWQPALSIEIMLFAALPLAAFLVNRHTSSEPWAANLASICLGLVILYLAAAPSLFFAEWKIFLTDLVSCLIFGSIVFTALNRRENR
jgi:hypothetical protein